MKPGVVIPAKAGIHFVFCSWNTAKIKMDPSFRWDDDPECREYKDLSGVLFPTPSRRTPASLAP